MASPLFDQMHIDHSKRVGDPIAAAATDGKIWTAAHRSIHLNEAVRRLMLKYWKRIEREGDASPAWDFFRSLKESEGQAMTSNEIALSSYTGGVFHIISVLNGTTVVKPLPPDYVDDQAAGLISWYDESTTNQYYYIESGNLVNVGGAATDTMTLKYIKAWTAMTYAYATDIPIPLAYFGQILDLAYVIAKEESPKVSPEIAGLAAAKLAIVEKEIG